MLFRLSSILGALAVVLGAMGAHGKVADTLAATGQLEHWKTASHYHLAHAAVVLFVAYLARESRGLRFAWGSMAAGVIVFSGSLYLLAYTQTKWLGAITPIGGLLMIIGWVTLAVVGAKKTQDL
jgi:uncharacterized membrane protein YgdD (TMEM256/DUF423 family)